MTGLVFCKPDGSQLMQRDILKHSLHPILKKLGRNLEVNLEWN